MLHPHIPHVSVGNRLVDSAHRQLFEIIQRIQRSIQEKNGTAVAESFRLFEEAAHAAFVVEERVAGAVGFDFSLHELAHQTLLKRYRQLRDELVARNGAWGNTEGDAYARYVGDWLVKHLDYESQPLRIVLDTYLYDFDPATGSGGVSQ